MIGVKAYQKEKRMEWKARKNLCPLKMKLPELDKLKITISLDKIVWDNYLASSQINFLIDSFIPKMAPLLTQGYDKEESQQWGNLGYKLMRKSSTIKQWQTNPSTIKSLAISCNVSKNKIQTCRSSRQACSWKRWSWRESTWRRGLYRRAWLAGSKMWPRRRSECTQARSLKFLKMVRGLDNFFIHRIRPLKKRKAYSHWIL